MELATKSKMNLYGLLLCALLIRTTKGGKLNMLTYEETMRPTQFSQIAQDRYGNVYVGGTNVLYKLSDGLRLLDRETDKVYTGPVKDALDCPPGSGSSCEKASLMDNEAVILENFPGQDYLLFCGTADQGLCQVISMVNLNNDHTLDSTNVVNLIGNRKSAYAFFGKKKHQFSDGHTLYVGMSHDGRPTEYSPKAVSARDVKQDQSGSRYMYNISYAYEANGIVSGMDIDEHYKKDYIVKYIYGFEHEGFSYFVTVQREDLITERYTTKLVRVCQGDPRFYSYTEVELSCRKAEQHSTFYNIAQAAYLSPVGKELAKKVSFVDGEQVLFVAFGKADDQQDTANSSYGYGMCMYTMSDIRKKLHDTQLRCYQGYGSLLPWITRSSPRCTFHHVKVAEVAMNESFCGAPTNVGIGSRYPMQAKANITNDHTLATSLGIVNYRGKTIAIVGTQDGHVMKYLVDGSNSTAYATINVGEGSTDTAVAKDIAFDSSEQHMYALTGNRVTKVPIQSCKVYNECSDCVTTRDPINCGWCGDYCSTRTECMTDYWTQDSCPPVIYSFEPRSGPVYGGTRVTITGHNFGASDPEYPNVSVNVLVALVDCVIDTRNSSSIVCQTGESKELREIDREVKVTVVDLTKSTANFNIEGPTTSDHESFSYKKPMMTEFSPKIGPKSGGTQITIKGQHLDIGSRLNITVGYLPCTPTKVNSSAILCSTSKWIPELEYLGKVRRRKRAVNPDTLLEGTVNVTIDSANLYVNDMFFTYKEDPVITSVEPKASILSGGLHIEVGGKNLNVVHEPKIVATVIGEEDILYKAPCKSSEDGLTMNCSSPTVSLTKFQVTEESPLKVNVHFLMDGVQTVYNLSESQPELSEFTYFIDPVFHKFDGYGYTHTFYEDDTHLFIQGKYIDLVDITEDLRVTVGETKCNVTKIGYNLVICAPERPTVFTDNEPSQRVVVHIGYLEFLVGHLQFAKRDPNILLAQILGPLMGFCAAFFVLFIVCWMKRTRRGPWKKQVNDEPHVRYTAGDMVHIGTNPDGTAVYRMPQNQNPYWPPSDQSVRQRTVAARDDSALIDDESRRLIEDEKLLVSRENLILCDIIGQGHFGCVYRGFMRKDQEKEEVEVAVKTLKSLSDSQYISSTDGRKFLEEALRMRDFDHPHILTLIGIALDKDCDMPLVVLPFMRHGDLLSFIRDDMNSPTVKDLIDFAIQVARGMAYLANLKFVHRDLAARNCMLDDQMNVKVADFGLSRDIYERDYYSSDDRKAKLPVKWMALESLEKGIYNNKTDVWSYGVVLWELMTRGICPYPEVDNWDIIKYLKSGRRMPQPQYCPDHLYMVMMHCWDSDPKLRPSFAELVQSVENIITNMLSAHEHVGLNVSYVNVPTTQGYLYPTPTPTASAPPEGAAYFGHYDHYDNNNLVSLPTMDQRMYASSDSGGSLPPRTFPYVNAASKSTIV